MHVESLTGRIHHNIFYGSFHGIEEVAALYAEAIAKGHVFNDSNKRTALISMLTFLEENDVGVDADQEHLAEWIIDLADGRATHKEFAPWLKTRLRGSLPAELA
ncbi:type II toxin-antitoxin system death-on-curing family toxin [uncultured Microbulbifer sp.]|uniref:type II toxin-antitoxin system death-on-curing family toxin n=1 Tax=uncultured Microbulbifer sp. TaxID=348147 RepID=UPI002604386F|nr:type II toxin-antitoxin system death-on-curing family toxin [uncultured Microbulbifer sp.]